MTLDPGDVRLLEELNFNARAGIANAALPLYAGFGLKRLYAYHHRVHADDATPTSGEARRG